ncbi:right-handed parallel beta-helix repeat-containing protein [Bradyrhizobium genosp. L]|uniref:right-handed parallel beta-helix repeat-containing protein n=1 Tax=Bradyrhizobium genosp. L TaxID=83637 RepID=UPI0018A33033|nr:right-handed parallel beta-helix repeat-containing protein [Bradyrhizobium genosp. L]QPF87628.1 right-handed parallel beta-helix repeat-containing protein [Bradyrhizobium genosp. L]
MMPLSRRQAVRLVSFVMATPLLGTESRAEPAPIPGTATFDMATFTATSGGDADAAFAKALAAIAKAANDAGKAGPVHIALNLERNASYRIKRTIVFKALHGFELNGNGAEVINTTRSGTITISGCNRLTVRDLTIDYDPLPFTQGTITAFDKGAVEITVKIDPGYPDDAALLASITDGFFKVMDRHNRSLKTGARDFLSPSQVQRLGDGLIKVRLQWSANDRFPSQLPIAVGDVVTIANSGPHAIAIDSSVATSLIDVKLLASPGMGIIENGGDGSILLQKVSVIPGPRPKGATTDRLISTNSDGSHFIAVARGPTLEDCSFANTSDDAINVHGFYYYVVAKPAPRHFLLSPKWDIGLLAGDDVESCDHATFRSLGRGKIAQLTKRHAPELKAKIAQIWKNRSPTTQPDLIYDVVLQQDLPLKVGDALSSLTHIGSGATVLRCSFHACGRVLMKAPNAIVENCQFSFSTGVALQAGSDIGFWSESGFADNLVFRNNRFSHCVNGANELTGGSGTLGTIYVGMVPPEGAKGFQDNAQNHRVIIEGNHIDDSFIYAIFVSNTDGLKIADNVIGQTFLRGNTFGAGDLFRIKPDSAIFVGRSANIEISNNVAARGRIATNAVAIDPSCDKRTLHLANNRLA